MARKQQKKRDMRNKPFRSHGEIPVANVESRAEMAKKMEKDKVYDRVGNLVGLMHILQSESSRVLGEINGILSDYNLDGTFIMKSITRLDMAVDGFFKDMKELFIGDEENLRNMREESDRFDRDFYRYMGIRYRWKPGEEDGKKRIGIHNFIGVGKSSYPRGRNVYIGRDGDGKLWISTDEELQVREYFTDDMFPGIKRNEYFLMDVHPMIYVDGSR